MSAELRRMKDAIEAELLEQRRKQMDERRSNAQALGDSEAEAHTAKAETQRVCTHAHTNAYTCMHEGALAWTHRLTHRCSVCWRGRSGVSRSARMR